MKFNARIAAAFLLFVFAQPHALLAQSSLAGETLHIARATGPIKIDGDLSDEGWQGVDTGHDLVRSQSRRQHPAEGPQRRAPHLRRPLPLRRVRVRRSESRRRFARRIPIATTPATASTTSAASSSTRGNSGRTATLFVVTPRNIQYDSIIDDASGEDSSPDFFWESATKITAHGWTLEMRIPFSSLRYKNVDPQTWAHPAVPQLSARSALPVLLREDAARVQLLRLPRQHARRAAAAAGRRPPRRRAVRQRAASSARPAAGLGSPLANDPMQQHVGVDVKFTPNADNAVDLTVKPDFSQVESDTAQISANERFALFFPEKRSVLPRGRRSVPDADSGRLHADDHRADLGRAGDRQSGRRPLHGARRRGRRRRQRGACPGRTGRRSRRRTSRSTVFVGARQARHRAARSSACS